MCEHSYYYWHIILRSHYKTCIFAVLLLIARKVRYASYLSPGPSTVHFAFGPQLVNVFGQSLGNLLYHVRGKLDLDNN